MQVIPVLDILDGIVVRGIAGRRKEYRPITSRLTQSHEPLEVANAIRHEFGFTRFYLADLDGILKQAPNQSLYSNLIASGFQLIVDPGIRDAAEARIIQDLAAAEIVVGLETCRTPGELLQIADSIPNVTFSLDLFQGHPRTARPYPRHELAGADTGWSEWPEEILRQAIDCNVTSIIVLDLSDVGVGTGGSTDRLCRLVRSQFPQVQLITGGGIRGREDLDRLGDLGVDAVLVASSLHDGRLCREDILST